VISESTTRAERIDRQLAKAGWSSSSRQVIEDLWLPTESAIANGSADSSGAQFVDYALLLPDGRPIAIVEAKKSSRAALEGFSHIPMISKNSGPQLVNLDQVAFCLEAGWSGTKVDN
jgi:type I site-specific restriction endonuclease